MIRDKLSIALVSPGWPARFISNGIATYVHNMRIALSESDVRVFVLAGRIVEGYDNKDVIDLRSIKHEKNLLKFLYQKMLWKIFRQNFQVRQVSGSILNHIQQIKREFGLQLVEMEETFGWAHIVKEKSSVPVVVRLHGPWFLNGPANGAKEDEEFKRRIKWERMGIENAVGISAPSLDVLNQVRSFYKLKLENARVIPNPILPYPSDQIWNLNKSTANHILFVGRFDKHKGGDLIIDAFSKILSIIPTARLTFIGPDPGVCDEAGRERKIKEYTNVKFSNLLVSGKMKYLGYQNPEEVVQFRQLARVTVVCSRYENFSYATLEAMVMGCPIVAARTGGLVELIQDERNGLQFEAGNSDDLADKIIRLLMDDELAVRLGQQALLDCEERYNPETVAQQTIEFYKFVIND